MAGQLRTGGRTAACMGARMDGRSARRIGTSPGDAMGSRGATSRPSARDERSSRGRQQREQEEDRSCGSQPLPHLAGRGQAGDAGRRKPHASRCRRERSSDRGARQHRTCVHGRRSCCCRWSWHGAGGDRRGGEDRRRPRDHRKERQRTHDRPEGPARSAPATIGRHEGRLLAAIGTQAATTLGTVRTFCFQQVSTTLRLGVATVTRAGAVQGQSSSTSAR